MVVVQYLGALAGSFFPLDEMAVAQLPLQAAAVAAMVLLVLRALKTKEQTAPMEALVLLEATAVAATLVATAEEVRMTQGEERDNLGRSAGMDWADTAVGAGAGIGNAAGTGIGKGFGAGCGTVAGTVADIGAGAGTADHSNDFADGRQEASKRAQRNPTPGKYDNTKIFVNHKHTKKVQ